MIIEELPFVNNSARQGNFWCVQKNGDFLKDYHVGLHYGMMAMEYATQNDGRDGWLCERVIEDIVKKERDLQPIERGFVRMITTAALFSRLKAVEVYTVLRDVNR